MNRLFANWRVWLATATLSVGLLCLAPTALANTSAVDGATIFQANCIGCHPNGSNIIRRGKNLKQRALKRNGMDSLVAVKTLVAQGKNNMSAYAERLSETEIEAVSTYVLEQAENGWH